MKTTKSAVDFREIARLEAGDSISLLPVIEKELIHYDIIRAMSENGFLENLCFQGGTSLRLCYGSDRFSEDLDFTGGVHFDYTAMNQLKQCIEDHLTGRYGLLVEVKPPKEKNDTGVNVSSWQVKVVTAPDRPDIPSQKIKIEVANVPSYTRDLVQISENYQLSSGAPLIIGVQSMEEIMADKLLALPASVNYVRHRDIWDLHWMSMNRVKPNAGFLDQKIKDYGITDYQDKLKARIESLPSIVNGPDFINQMSRFLKRETVENSIAKDDFRSVLVGSLTRILSVNQIDNLNLGLDMAPVDSVLTDKYKASPASGAHSGIIKAISVNEVIQDIGRETYLLWPKSALSGDQLIVGKNVHIDKEGKVSEIKSKSVGIGQ